MRGTAGRDPEQRHRGRITPACAGNSFADPAGRHGPGGSPPRVRGTVFLHFHPKPHLRITPACAGNRPSAAVTFMVRVDHPRVCGEQVFFLVVGMDFKGSPPRVRGTGRQSMNRGQISRITPACAGNRAWTRQSHPAAPDHPRVCGEQRIPCSIAHITSGSPPRVRGTAFSDLVVGNQVGITPACAGNSRITAPRWISIRDHPRVCGEQSSGLYRCICILGSPPRVRGTAFSALISVNRRRITPACAGNSLSLFARSLPYKDHPRVCGEQWLCRTPQACFEGSPPRVRGTGGDYPGLWPPGGITPACAGNRSVAS